MPKRIQRKRTKGWRMPVGAVCVTRPGRFGNPFASAACREAGYSGTDAEIKQRCVEAFEIWLGPYWRENWDGEESKERRLKLLESLPMLRGKDLACWCRLCPEHADGKPLGVECPNCPPCHADVLLEIANR